jgi:hypothetical protein
MQEAQRIMQHGILASEVELYKKALLDDAEQLAASVDTQPHIEMCNIAIDTLSNGQVLNSNVQAHDVRRSPALVGSGSQAASAALSSSLAGPSVCAAMRLPGAATPRACSSSWLHAFHVYSLMTDLFCRRCSRSRRT